MSRPRLGVLPPGLSRSPVCLAWTRARPGDRQELADHMWRGLCGGDDTSPAGLRLGRGPLGQPLARLGEAAGPWLSFSRTDRALWAAMRREAGVGIDLAGPEEFAPGYPWQRMARAGEMDRAREAAGSLPRAAAMLWAAKEAAVKARGVGFHLMDPRDVAVGRFWRLGEGFVCAVDAAGPLKVWACQRQEGWLAVALAPETRD